MAACELCARRLVVEGVAAGAGPRMRTVAGVRMAAIAWGLAATATCGTVRSRSSPAPAVESDRTIAELRGKNAGYVRRIEELENRVFILEDQLESRKLTYEQQAIPILPARKLTSKSVVAGQPAGKNAAVETVAADPASNSWGPAGPSFDRAPAAPNSLVDEQAIEYVGEATFSEAPAARGAAAQPRAGGGSHSARWPRPQLRLWAEPPESTQSASASQSSGERSADRNAVGNVEPLRIYREAMVALRAERHSEALLGFRSFLQKYPQHDYADNAQYWMGECFYDQRRLDAAERAFRTVIEVYPHGNKVPDALLKLGLSLHFGGDVAGSRTVLESLTRAFPKHEAARLAAAQLANPATEPPPRSSAEAVTNGIRRPKAIRPGLVGP